MACLAVVRAANTKISLKTQESPLFLQVLPAATAP